jgi:hypothetical protein
MRLRAIFCSLWFGILPWKFYEDSCHYEGGSYIGHLRLNLETAVMWATWREPEDWHQFESEVNPTWGSVWKDMFRTPK